jgi:hypothetical protein
MTFFVAATFGVEPLVPWALVAFAICSFLLTI